MTPPFAAFLVAALLVAAVMLCVGLHHLDDDDPWLGAILAFSGLALGATVGVALLDLAVAWGALVGAY